jgi:LuxR family transcriptional regulator, maltose regulon positive regulatory protein
LRLAAPERLARVCPDEGPAVTHLARTPEVALSTGAHPHPDQFVKELSAKDSALIGYQVEEVLNPQPPQVWDVLLSTSILDRVSTEAALEMTGNERVAGILTAVTRANGFIEPAEPGVVALPHIVRGDAAAELRREYPRRVATLYRRAAR